MSWNNVYPEDECSICMNPYNIVENITWFPCNHCVCLKCYMRCNSCPICRTLFNKNTKPPIFKTIADLNIAIENELTNNGDATEMIHRVITLKQYV